MSPQIFSITISGLGFIAPDGRAVLSGLDLAFRSESTGITGRNGVGKSTLLRLIAAELAPTTGRVSVAGTVAMLRQTVRVSSDETIADLMGVAPGLAILRKAEAGEAGAEEIAAADWTLDARVEEALAKVGLEVSAQTPLMALSGGQRSRAALAGAILSDPDFLLLDEPTNNLDREGRQAVRELLRGWRGGAIVVSHDRELLEEMDAIVELTELGAARYGGGWSAYRERKAIEQAAAEAEIAHAEKTLGLVKRQARIAAERQARRDAGGRRKAARGDQPAIVLGAARQRAEESAGGNRRLAERQEDEAEARLASARARMEVVDPLSAGLPSTGLSRSRTVLALAGVTAGYAEGQPVIRDLSLTVTGPERVAITGPNGSGKSTLLSLVAGSLQPWAGEVRTGVPFRLFDQRVDLLDPARSIAANFLALNPGTTENECRAALARFRFRAEAADQVVGTLSGGQLLRAGLACVLGSPNPPQLLILDEPGNHLDIESLAAIEKGLSAYDGALLVVSHDSTFLDAIGVTREVEMRRA